MLPAILGSLKAGKTYVPLDPSYPFERLEYMVRDSAADVIVTNDRNAGLAKSLGRGERPLSVANLDLRPEPGRTPFEPRLPSLAVGPDSLAYILYTSGSTGRPKGVIQNHRNVLHFARLYAKALSIGANDRLSLLASYSFDAAVMDIFGALLNGAALCPWSVKRLGVNGMADWIEREEITVLHAVPTVFRALAGALREGQTIPNVRAVVLGGEEAHRWDVETFRRHFTPGSIFVNGLGPTESTLALQFFLEHGAELPDSFVPVGKAVEDTEILLLDEEGEPSELTGEIAIRSRHLALGYWGRPDLTDAAFLPDPQGGVRRIYRTGDMGALLPDGSVQFLGRRDSLVKIRGHRIELSEIESTLAGHPAVSQAVVAARKYDDEDHERRLVAYVVPNRPASGTAAESAAATDLPAGLKRFLQGSLPDYMCPEAVLVLESLPLLPNGKVDRRALPAPPPAVSDSYAPPRNAVEEVLSKIWAPLLGVPRVGVDEDFFALGGHSLAATQVVSRVRDVFRLDIPLQAVFESPTIAAFARRIAEELGEEATEGAPPPVPLARDGRLELSFAQQRLWFLDQLEPGSASYVISRAVRLAGDLDVQALEKAFQSLLARHEALRTRFDLVDDGPVQVVEANPAFGLARVDLRAWPEDSRELEAGRHAFEAVSRPFQLSTGPVLRALLVRLGELDHLLVVSVHHIASDDWSMAILVTELSRLYREFADGEPASLAPLPVQYADFAIWQRARMRGDLLARELSYWTRHLASLAPLNLPTDRPRPKTQSFRGKSHAHRIPRQLSDAIRRLARREGATLYMTLLAAFQVLLGRYAGQEDIAIGSPIAGRNRVEIEGLIGFFVNTLVLRTDLSGNPTFREVLRRVRQVSLEAYAHQDVPFERIVEELHPERSLDRNPLVQVLFGVEPVFNACFELSGVKARPAPVENGTTRFDLEIAVEEDDAGLLCKVLFATDLFDADSVSRMMEHFEVLLAAGVSDPDRPILDLPLMTEAERRRVVEGWNRTGREYSAPATVHALFERQAATTPDATAVRDDRESVTFAELDRRANRLAHLLRRRGVGLETPVAVCLERSTRIPEALLGILKAGGAWVPLDPAFPAERLAWLVRDSGASVVLTETRLAARFGEHAGVVRIDADVDPSEPAEVPGGAGARPDSLAYVIYTSGSTGIPKGVEATHAACLNRLAWMWREYPFEEGEVCCQKTAISFVDSVWEIFGPLLQGIPSTILGDEVVRDPRSLVRSLSEAGVTRIVLVPSLLRALLDTGMDLARELPALAWWTTSGETLPLDLYRKFRRAMPDAVLLNLYGSSEVSADVTAWDSRSGEPQEAVPIGRPISNCRIYILDPKGQPVPIGVPGEIHVGGSGLARGYRGHPDWTAERFVPDPFSKTPGKRLFRTGDRGRYREDGQIEFLGRTDFQIKLRGRRIEPGEIEAALGEHAAVAEAVVTARERAPGGPALAAYVLTKPGHKATAAGMREFLASRLPEFMIPSAFVFLEVFPRTASGKLDRARLPEPRDLRDETIPWEPPRDTVEEKVARVWREVLGMERVGVRDNFFENGGHSLLAVTLAAKLEKEFGRPVGLATIFRAPTIAELAAVVRERRRSRSRTPSLVALQPNGSRPPFYCVHAVPGIIQYHLLARSVGPDQPFYGLQSQGLEGASRPYETIEEMAAHYLAEIRERQPRGPYYLGGYSFGGKVAFEMARQLRALGEETAFLAFFDTLNIPTIPSPTALEHARARARVHVAFLRAAGLKEKLSYLQGRAETARSLAVRGVGALYELLIRPMREALFDPHQRARRKVLATNFRAAARYVPGHYEGRVTIFRATDRPDGFRDRLQPYPLLGWEKLCAGVELIEVPGGHSSLMEEEANVRALGRALGERLRAAQAMESAGAPIFSG